MKRQAVETRQNLRAYEDGIEPVEWEEIHGNEVTEWIVMLCEGCIIGKIKSLNYMAVVVRQQCSNYSMEKSQHSGVKACGKEVLNFR